MQWQAVHTHTYICIQKYITGSSNKQQLCVNYEMTLSKRFIYELAKIWQRKWRVSKQLKYRAILPLII